MKSLFIIADKASCFQSSVFLRKRISYKCRNLSAACLLFGLLLTGCGAEKESLFEEEHDLPAHWPNCLVDAADKIGERMGQSEAAEAEPNYEGEGNATKPPEAEQHESELRDLVEWIPEVAADTDLTEAQWLPIYEICEVMRKHLSRGDVSASDIEEDFRRLQALLLESAKLLPTSTEGESVEELDPMFDKSTESASSEILGAGVSSGDEA